MKIKFIVEWSENVKNFKGLPRPFARYKKDNLNVFNLARKTPIPWQSKPNSRMSGISLIPENENMVYISNICAYCGIFFLNNEKTIRWTTLDTPLSKDGNRVFSDVHPFHLECMEQARTFCPHMKKTTDDEFETGTYSKLRSNADEQIRPYLT
jgi:hypothetical protein